MAATGQLSPDGQWMWDGAQWVPAGQPAAAPAAPAAPAQPDPMAQMMQPQAAQPVAADPMAGMQQQQMAAPAMGQPQMGQPQMGQPQMGGAMMGGAPAAGGSYGKVRSPIMVIVLSIVTFGIYGIVWWYSLHEENKVHGDEGPGGLLAILLWFIPLVNLVWILMRVFGLGGDIGRVQQKSGMEPTVSAMTAFWNLIPYLGALIWFWKLQSGINKAWIARGHPEA